MLQLNKLITDNTNLIEIYLINNYINNCLNLNIKDDLIEKIKNKYKFKQKNDYKSYYKEGLIYTYDINNDSQVVNNKLLENMIIINNYSVLIYNENKYPTYIFSCSDDIDHYTNYSIIECRINNRISINIRIENEIKILYIQYKHSNNVDIEKIENIINSIMKNINN